MGLGVVFRRKGATPWVSLTRCVSDETVSSQEGSHHTLLALTYVAQILQRAPGETDAPEGIRRKLQQLLWRSPHCDAAALHGQ